jgi:hypothetical protein
MKKNISIILLSFVPFLAFSQNTDLSHCLPNEKVLINANMGTGTYDKFKPNGKTLSICSDKEKDPISRIVYRYGKSGAVEMEHVGTPQSKMYISNSEQIRTRITIFWFKKGDFAYVISEYSGMAGMVDLQVFKGDKRLARLNAENATFVSNTENIDFYRSKSPALIVKDPPFNLEL